MVADQGGAGWGAEVALLASIHTRYGIIPDYAGFRQDQAYHQGCLVYEKKALLTQSQNVISN